MNILLIGSKSDCKSYSEILKTAPDTNVLGAVTQLTDKNIDSLRGKYNPHTILFDSAVPHKKIDISIAAASIHSKFPLAKLIIICESFEVNIFKNIGCYAVISDTITNVQLLDVLNNAGNSYGIESTYTEQIEPVKETYQTQKRYRNTNSGLGQRNLFIALAATVIALIIIAIVVNLTKGSSDMTATPDEATTTCSSTKSTNAEETSTISQVVADTTLTYKKIQKLEHSVEERTTVTASTATTVVRKKSAVISTSQTATKPKNSTNNNDGSVEATKATQKATKSNPIPSTTQKATSGNGGSVSYNNNSYVNTSKEAVKVKLSYFTKTLAVKDSVTITATISPDSAKNKKIKWTTSDKSIATVKQTGYVKAKAVGTVTITAKVGSATAVCTIKVVDRSDN